ncbi:helix-turn-helix transcriptional regulator [Cryobacterium sp. Y62]|uniref:ArsR/SmtB family transcription factor n=1 Tax=Cryobacterium sp. Y62 TaxID=2048284 RepID=UPI000CE50379|nr:metalloregulator ArsR/SmtB family transcription factor [Cryobacterium sp. Y62]
MPSSARHDDADAAQPITPLDRTAAEVLARTLRAVADPTRLQLLSMIAGAVSGEVTVGDLATTLGMTQPTITHHLRIMVDDGLLVRDQRGRQVWHSIAASRKSAILDLLR